MNIDRQKGGDDMSEFDVLDIMSIFQDNVHDRKHPCGCPEAVGLTNHCAGNPCDRCWALANSESDVRKMINKTALILLKYCKSHETCEDCCLNGKCMLANPDIFILDEGNYEEGR